MKKKRVKSLASPSRPQGNGLPSSTRPCWKGRCAPLRSSQSQAHNYEKARAYAFLLLKFRLRSEKELAQRLKQKGFSGELAEATVSFLKDKEFIDDRVFAQGWVAARLKRPFGLRRIKQELFGKGLAKQIIEDSLVQAKKDYSESQIVSQLAQQRFSKLADLEPLKAKARVYAYLMRRGFSPDVVGEVMRTVSLKGNGPH